MVAVAVGVRQVQWAPFVKGLHFTRQVVCRASVLRPWGLVSGRHGERISFLRKRRPALEKLETQARRAWGVRPVLEKQHYGAAVLHPGP